MTLRAFRILGLAAVAALAATASARADAVLFSDFSSIAGQINLRGSATTVSTGSGTAISLTQAGTENQAGSAFLASPFSLGAGGSFSAAFQFQITPGSTGPADGFAFVLAQSVGSTSPLEPGGNLGYHGLANSIAIEFDTYENQSPTTGGAPIADGGAGDVNDNHVAIDVNGELDDYATASPYGVGDNSPWFCSGAKNPFGCLANGDVWTVLIGYLDGKLSVAVKDGTHAPDLVISNYAIDIPGTIGTSTPYLGFTGGVGGLSSTQNILDLGASSGGDYAPPPVPEPTSLALLGTGLLGIGFLRLRRRRA